MPVLEGFPGGAVVKNLPANAGDLGDVNLIPGSGILPGGGNGNPLQYSCLGNPMYRGAWYHVFRPVLAQSQSSPTWRSQKGLVFGVKAFTAPPLC